MIGAISGKKMRINLKNGVAALKIRKEANRRVGEDIIILLLFKECQDFVICLNCKY